MTEEQVMDGMEERSILRVTEQNGSTIRDMIARESPLTIVFNNQELVTMLCTPIDLKYLAIGFLYSEGLLKSRGEITKALVDEQRGIVRVDSEIEDDLTRQLTFKRFITSGCGRGASFYSATDVQDVKKVESQVTMSARDILALAKAFQYYAPVFRKTGCTHSAALCEGQKIIIFNEDIGRHNAVDKILGECLLNDIPTENRLIITTGRISSEILLKVAKRSIPILISSAAPTDLAVKLANNLGVTIIGFVRGRRMNVYTHPWRVITENLNPKE